MNYLQKEPNGQRNVISRLSKAVPPSAQQQKAFESQTERTQIKSPSKPTSRERSLNSSLNTLDQINTSQMSPGTSPRKTQRGGQSPDVSPDTVRTRRATLFDLVPLQRTKSSAMVGLKNSARLDRSSTFIESRMNGSGDETSRSKRVSNGNLLEQIVISGTAAEEKSMTTQKSISITLKRKKSTGDYARTTSHLKLRIQQKLEEGKSISQNDHLYANIINQYNTFRPDQVFAALKQKVEAEPPSDLVQRREAAKQEANNAVYRLHKKQEVASTEHVTSQMEKLAKAVQIKSNSFFNNRNRLLANDDEREANVKKALHEAHVKGSQTPKSARPGYNNHNPYGLEGDSRNDQNTSKNSKVPGGNKVKRPLTERVRPKTGAMNSSSVSNNVKHVKPEKKRKYFVEKKREASVENLQTEGSVEGSKNINAMFSFINEEVRKLKENSDKVEGYHSKFRLFNYSLWQLYGDRPRQNALLRRIELHERSKLKDKLEDSPVKNMKVHFHTGARTYSLSPTKQRNL